jgi:hypothetical protein
MSGLGAPPGIIAGVIGITEQTLQKVYAKEIAAGPDKVKLEAMRELFAAAKGNGAGKVTAAVRLLDLLTADDKPDDASSKIKMSGLSARLVTFRPTNPSLWSCGEEIQAYDEYGTALLVISEDEDRL